MAYIEINDCSKIIKKTTILDHIDLKLEKNRIYGFVGRNGSGKTMLFKILTGLAQPSSPVKSGSMGSGFPPNPAIRPSSV